VTSTLERAYDAPVVRGRGRGRGDTQRIAAASLGAIAERHVVGHGDQVDTAEALQQALMSDSPAGPEVDAAIAEMRARSADPQVYVMAAAVYTEVRDPTEVLILRLFELAGLNLDEARAWRAAHPGGGWSTPQAPAYGER
jgi:hypothetical protein